MKYRAVVVDTSVLVSGFLTRNPGSPTAGIVDRMLEGSLPFLVSTALLAEYREVLLRDRIRARHELEEEEIDRILATIASNAIVREPGEAAGATPSKGDQHLWDLLAAEAGSILVTGDRLRVEKPPAGARVVLPADFLGDS